MPRHYEVQVRHHTYGWWKAGNWPAWTVKEGIKSLEACADGLSGEGSVHDYRLVRLKPIVISVRKARRKFEDE